MARFKRGAKTQAVRDYLAQHPEANSKAVVAGLKAQGMGVKLTLVHSIRYKKATKAQQRRAPAVRMAARKAHASAVSFDQLVEVKRLVDTLGGADQIRQALDALAQLQ